jgi:hypothetical protein
MRWSKDGKTIDLVGWDSRERLCGMRYDVICVDNRLPDEDEQRFLGERLNPGGQLVATMTGEWSVNYL